MTNIKGHTYLSNRNVLHCLQWRNHEPLMTNRSSWHGIFPGTSSLSHLYQALLVSSSDCRLPLPERKSCVIGCAWTAVRSLSTSSARTSPESPDDLVTEVTSCIRAATSSNLKSNSKSWRSFEREWSCRLLTWTWESCFHFSSSRQDFYALPLANVSLL